MHPPYPVVGCNGGVECRRTVYFEALHAAVFQACGHSESVGLMGMLGLKVLGSMSYLRSITCATAVLNEARLSYTFHGPLLLQSGSVAMNFPCSVL